MTVIKRYSFLVIISIAIFSMGWQRPVTENYTIDISADRLPVISGHLSLGTHTNANGGTLDANSLYFIKDGKPWFPVMGEFHFSRFPRDQWELSILKMKAAGIDVVATYVFWIYHEEEEGKWDWTGNRDLRYFAELCAKHHMFLFTRIGPWCHGEVRNGGFPDWLLQKTFRPRTNDSAYLDDVQQLFSQVNAQLKGLYFKDGGPVIGAQIENEFRFNNPKGLEHILALKKIAVAAGIDVPYYTATGWPGSNIKQTELIPVWGGYPEAPWDKRTTQLPLSENYLFNSLRSDPGIGNDLLGNITDTTNYSGYRYPYATAEMGAGIQVTYHRRPIIQPDDVTGLAYAKIGSGANLIGYYMFHGGTNAIGKRSTLQESKATKYPNDYPILNYDFQAAIGEWGELRPSFRQFKLLHYFLRDFGEQLVQDYAFFPDKKPAGAADNETLRWSMRANNGSGFLFINNFQRQLAMHAISNVQFNIKTKEEVLKIPQQPIEIPANAQMIWPVNIKMDSASLVYATAQPVCILQNSKEQTFVFTENEGIKPEYLFDEKNIGTVSVSNAAVTKNKGKYLIKILQPGYNCLVKLQLTNGKTISLLTLTHQQALDSWKFTNGNKEYLCITDAEIIADGSVMHLQSIGKAATYLAVYPAVQNILADDRCKLTKKSTATFVSYSVAFPAKNPIIKWQQDKAPAIKADTSGGIPLYKTTLKAVPAATYWRANIPSTVLQGLHNAFLEINYEGDTQAAYADGKLIADDFYTGAPMKIGLNQFKNIPGKKLVLLVTALNDSAKIYFEKGIREPMTGKQAAVIKSIGVVPQYETILKF